MKICERAVQWKMIEAVFPSVVVAMLILATIDIAVVDPFLFPCPLYFLNYCNPNWVSHPYPMEEEPFVYI